MLNLKRSLGQNFLTDKNIIEKITLLAQIKNRFVIEIGPGTGNLTESIVKKNPKKIVLIEKDKRFCDILRKKYNSNKNYTTINKDILDCDLSKYNYKKAIVFGNLPYNVSTQILAKFISESFKTPFFHKLIFMFQKEVAKRIMAKYKSKEYGRLAILTNFNMEVVGNFQISRNCFFPKPQVDSTILVFKPKNKISYEIKKIKNLEKITNILFSNKRKMINKAFSKLFDNYNEVARQLNINLHLRPSELSFDDYYRITEYYEKNE
mgnify:CR=1 FL=1